MSELGERGVDDTAASGWSGDEQELQEQMGTGFTLEWSFVPYGRSNEHSAHVTKLVGAEGFSTTICCSCGESIAVRDEVRFTEAENLFRRHVREYQK